MIHVKVYIRNVQLIANVVIQNVVSHGSLLQVIVMTILTYSLQ